MAAHAAVLFIEFPVDFHDLARSLGTACEEAAADDRVREGEGFHDVARFGDASIGEYCDAATFGGLRTNIERGELGNAHSSDDARRADGAGALSNLDGIRAALGQKLNTRAARHISGDDWQRGELGTNGLHRLANSTRVSVGCRDRHGIQTAFDHGAHMGEEGILVECAIGKPRWADCRTADEAEFGVPRWFCLEGTLLRNPFDIAQGEETFQVIVLVDNEQFVDADIVGEKPVGPCNGIAAEFVFPNC